MVTKPVLEIRDASMTFGARTLWSNLNLAVQPHEFIAVIGSNGSGKSTLLKAILGQQELTEGGIKERMHRARTAYRQQQDARLKQLEEELPRLKQALAEAQAEAAKWKAAFEDIKQRALKAYYRQAAEIKGLKEKLKGIGG